MKIDDFCDGLISSVNARILGKKTDSYDILTFANLVACFEAASYYSERMSKAQSFENGFQLMTHAMGLRTVEGQILEFGVATGKSINHISSLTEQVVYGFDVFTGLPETWRTGFERGVFNQQNMPRVNNNVELVVGLFENTLDAFSEAHREPISLLHVDCDLYAGAKAIFDKLGNLIIPGTVIVFDEYFNYPGWRHHEYKAFQEFVVSNNLKYRYDSFVSAHQQVCIVIC
jgi:predicted O-methyltransferase YrrM